MIISNINYFIFIYNIGIKGEFSNVQMFNKSNLFGIVGSDNNPKLKQSEVIIWDDKNQKILYKFKIKKKVVNLKITFNKIIIVCETIIYVFNTKNFQLIDVIKTGYNPQGLIGINYPKENEEKTILVYPSSEENNSKLTIKNYEKQSYIYLNPHANDVTLFSLSTDGKFLITVGKNDEKLRIYDPKTGKNLDQLTIDKMKIKFISINSDMNLLGTSSEKGKIDIWSLNKAYEKLEEKEKIIIENNVTNIHKGIFTKIDIPFNHVTLKDTFENYQFTGINNLIIITTTGEFHHYNFTFEKIKKKEGEFKLIKKDQLF